MALISKAQALIMIVNRDGKDLLGSLLTNHVLIKLFLDGPRRGDVGKQALGAAPTTFFLVDNRLAQLDAFAADVYVARPFDERTDVPIALATEGAISIAIPSRVARGSAASSPGARFFRRHAFSFR